MEEQAYISEDGYELLDVETSKMIEELTKGIEIAPYPNEEGGEDKLWSA